MPRGREVKTLLHQSEHVVPASDSDNSDIMIGKHTYLEWLNLWFTRALLGVDNDAATLPLTSTWKAVAPVSPPATPAPVDISGAAVARIATKTYTGKAIKPSPAITYADKQLVRGVDYDLLYKANVKVGTAKVAIVGKGAYTGSKTVKFKIKKASVKKAKAKKLKARKYTGRAIKPKPKLTYKGKKLKAGRDYKLTYKNNKYRGVAKIIVKGKGNFKGKKVVKFRIR